ncbi:MAG TPA: BON domain-containing protein [Thermoleophilaceae bacterium]|nr:BON domain-containing protein [Thermoleophilaceae bacterium]
MLRKLLFGAAAVGAISWLAKNQNTAKAYVNRYGGQLKGAATSATPGAGREPAEERLNDPALARKVESEVFRDEEIPKGNISVNAEYGVIYLRGEVPSSEVMQELANRARAVDGVRAVENLTHLPGEKAPAKDEVGTSPA